MTEEEKIYQITILLPIEGGIEGAQKKIEEIKKLITKKSGEIKEDKSLEENLEQKRIAYPIKKQTEAFFLTFKFSIHPDKVNIIKQELNSDEILLRYLITEKIEPKPESVTNAKKEKASKTQKTSSQTKDIESEIIDKIEPLINKTKKEKTEAEATKEAEPRTTSSSEDKKEKKEKTKIEDLDKKLDEILNE